MADRTYDLRNCTIPFRVRHYTLDEENFTTDDKDDTGWRLHEDLNSHEKPCGICKGSGEADDGETCSICDRNGMVEDETDWSPQVNLLYPLPDDFEVPNNWREKLVNMTIVQVHGEPCLAQRKSDMNMSWDICETYINLGYYPPAEIAEPPTMASRGESRADQEIMMCCMESCSIMRQRLIAQIARLTTRLA